MRIEHIGHTVAFIKNSGTTTVSLGDGFGSCTAEFMLLASEQERNLILKIIQAIRNRICGRKNLILSIELCAFIPRSLYDFLFGFTFEFNWREQGF